MKKLGAGGGMVKHGGAPLAMKGSHPIKVKHVMLLDCGDGAYVDASVKVKPHVSDPNKLAVKCVDLARLLDALKRMGLKLAGPLVRGGKHHIAIVYKADLADALLLGGGGAGMLDAGSGVKAPAMKKLDGGKVKVLK